MKKIKRFVICTLATLFGIFLFVGFQFTPVVEAAPTRTLYLIGDSWTQQPAADGLFQQQLASRNLSETVTIQDFAISGSTAAEWAANQDNRLGNITEIIKNDSLDGPVVYLTLGGNDLINAFFNGPNPAAYDAIGNNVRTVISELKATRDDVQIVIGGYDITNPAAPSGNPIFTCNDALQQLFGTTDPAVANPYIIQLFDTLTNVANEFEGVYTVNTYGSLQGTPGMPNLSQWSPLELIEDCIHPNNAGYALHLNTVFDNRLESLLAASTGPLDRQIFLPIIVGAE